MRSCARLFNKICLKYLVFAANRASDKKMAGKAQSKVVQASTTELSKVPRGH